MDDFEIIFYEKNDGSVPVTEFIDCVDKDMKANGNVLREPHTKHLEDGIFS